MIMNLILNSLLNVLDDAKATLILIKNRTFKSDKVFLQNIGVWNKMFQKASRFDSVQAREYRWPGETYGLN